VPTTWYLAAGHQRTVRASSWTWIQLLASEYTWLAVILAASQGTRRSLASLKFSTTPSPFTLVGRGTCSPLYPKHVQSFSSFYSSSSCIFICKVHAVKIRAPMGALPRLTLRRKSLAGLPAAYSVAKTWPISRSHEECKMNRTTSISGHCLSHRLRAPLNPSFPKACQ
jgi:hypothetical protein